MWLLSKNSNNPNNLTRPFALLFVQHPSLAIVIVQRGPDGKSREEVYFLHRKKDTKDKITLGKIWEWCARTWRGCCADM
ncbi:unnamed protein product [Pylaiella littoralis]